MYTFNTWVSSTDISKEHIIQNRRELQNGTACFKINPTVCEQTEKTWGHLLARSSVGRVFRSYLGFFSHAKCSRNTLCLSFSINHCNLFVFKSIYLGSLCWLFMKNSRWPLVRQMLSCNFDVMRRRKAGVLSQLGKRPVILLQNTYFSPNDNVIQKR